MQKVKIIVLLFMLSCTPQQERIKELHTIFPEVVCIGNFQYIAVDSSGNIHLVNMHGETRVILEYREIENLLDRDFTSVTFKK